MKHSNQRMTKITSDFNYWGYFIKGWGHFINGWFIGGIKYFNSTFEEYKVVYPDETSNHKR